MPYPPGHYILLFEMTTTHKRMTKQRAPKTKRLKLDSRPLDEQQIQTFISHFNKYGSFPGSKIPCIVTGKLTTCVGPWMTKKIKEFGSAESLLRNYTCRQALKKKNATFFGSKKKKKGAGEGGPLVKEEDGRYDIPLVNPNKPSRLMTDAELAKDSETLCFRPDIFLNNGRHCDGCHYFRICRCGLKTLPKHIHFFENKFISSEVRKSSKNK